MSSTYRLPKFIKASKKNKSIMVVTTRSLNFSPNNFVVFQIILKKIEANNKHWTLSSSKKRIWTIRNNHPVLKLFDDVNNCGKVTFSSCICRHDKLQKVLNDFIELRFKDVGRNFIVITKYGVNELLEKKSLINV